MAEYHFGFTGRGRARVYAAQHGQSVRFRATSRQQQSVRTFGRRGHAIESGIQREHVVAADSGQLGRFTEVDLRELVRNNQRFLEYVRVGTLEVCDPKTEQAIPYDGLVDMIKKVADWVAENEARALMEQYEAAMEKYEAEMEAWEEACAAEKKAAKEAKREPNLPAEPVKPADLPKEKPAAIEVDESGVQQDPVEGSEMPENVAPPPKGSSTEVTREVPGESELLAAVDQHDAEMRGEANAPPSESGAGEADEGETGLLEDDGSDAGEEDEEGGYSEEELLSMGLDALKDLAVKDFGIAKGDVKKLRAKKEVVALIMEAGASEDEE